MLSISLKRKICSYRFTSQKGRRRNSSVRATSWKFWSAYLWDFRSSSSHEWASAKLLIPRQLEGCSCRSRNLQHASLTLCTWRRLATGSRTYSIDRTIFLRHKLIFSQFQIQRVDLLCLILIWKNIKKFILINNNRLEQEFEHD